MYLQKNGFTQIPVYSSSVSNPLISSATLDLPPKPIQNILSSVVTKSNTSSITNTNKKMLMIL
jgi:hypothetical protein